MLLDSIVNKVKIFLSEYASTDYNDIIAKQNNANKLTIYDYTSKISIRGKLNVVIIMSFEESIIRNMAKMFLDGKEIVENEKRIIYDSVVKETSNMIIGLSLPSFKNSGKGLDMEPPAIIKYAEIQEYDNIPAFREELITKFGKLSISITNYNIGRIDKCYKC